MRHYFKPVLFILGLLLFTFGCQKEDTTEIQNNTTQQKSVEVTYVDWDHFKLQNKPVSNKITSINASAYSIDRIDSEIYGFSIDESEVQIIEQNNFTTYTFPVIRENPDLTVVENYIYKAFEDGTYSQFLLTYNYILDENDNLVLDTNYLDILPIDDDSLILGREPCFPEFTQVGTEWVCVIRFKCTGDGHEIGDDCNCGNPGYDCLRAGLSCDFEPVFGWTSCTSSGTDTDTDDNNNNTNTTGGNHTGDDTTSTGEDFVFSTPTTRSKVERLVENCLNDGSAFTGDGEAQMLNSSYIDLSSHNLTDAQQWEIYQYLITANNCSDESRDFIDIALDALDEGGEVDFPNKIILDSSFVNNVKLKCAYDKLTSDNNPLFRNTVGAFIDDPKFNLTFKVGNCATTNDQCTDSSDPYSITITFEDVGLDPVEMASAILHEAIHAEMARFIEQYTTGEDVNNRPRIFELYKWYKEINTTAEINHIYMTETYINPISSALRQFDNNSYSTNHYKSFAWDGLRNWDANDFLGMDPLADLYDNYRTLVIENSTICD
ncbi:MAG: hypothetical protein ACJA1H_000501 [Glaciecola sp.]|jgi:hypothetical protein